jgi:predicted transcriptional regulator
LASRDKYHIILDVLNAAGRNTHGSSLTTVIKEASLNIQQAKELVIDLLELGLLEFNSKERTLRTTTKGWRFVRLYENLNQFVPIYIR